MSVDAARTNPMRAKTLLACVFLVGILAAGRAASASVFFHFSTGQPDGKIATASRPGPTSGANQETESADDFIVSTPDTVITHATFFGLLPSGVSLSTDISQVRVEIYRVFPKDSTDPPSGAVPTRVNSPSDVEFDDRDSAAGNLIFSTLLLNSDFEALNSVDTGIHPKPNQTTLGEGAVSGQEVLFNVIFTTPFSLPPDHYFFIPQVLLSNPDDHFLWLSAPKPIASPGTPFPPGFTDLQSWIRNANLDPDWLRIGTDVVGSGAFNAAFSLDSGEIRGAPALSHVGLGVLALLLVGGVPLVLRVRRTMGG